MVFYFKECKIIPSNKITLFCHSWKYLASALLWFVLLRFVIWCKWPERTILGQCEITDLFFLGLDWSYKIFSELRQSFLSCSFSQGFVHEFSCSNLMGKQWEIWNVSSSRGYFYWLTTATCIPKFRIFPNSVPEYLEEVVTVTEDNFLPKIRINGETKPAKCGTVSFSFYWH